MISPLDIGKKNLVIWTTPKEILSRGDIDNVKLYWSTSENSGYSLLNTINFPVNQIPSEYTDGTSSDRNRFYLVTFGNNTYESPFGIASLYPTPRELRLINTIKMSMPSFFARTEICDAMTIADYTNGLNLALQIFNTYPPQTYFTIDNFPRQHEYFLVGLGQLISITNKFLPVSIRDFNFNDPGGVVFQVDRGAKFKAAMDAIFSVYSQYMPLVKMDFASGMFGTGTVALPLSMGGKISNNILNVLNIFTAVGN